MDREQAILGLTSRVDICVKVACRKVRSISRSQVEDLTSAAWLGAIQAVDRYDERPEATLETFATHRIVGSIKDYLRTYDNLGRQHRIDMKNGKAEPVRHVPVQALKHMSDPKAMAVSELTVERIDLLRILMRAQLTEREIQCVFWYYGQEMTQAEIAKRIGVCYSRASQILTRARKKLRAVI